MDELACFEKPKEDVAPPKIPSLFDKPEKMPPVVKKEIKTVARHQMALMYPADPFLEPELVGMTYLEVAVFRQVRLAAAGSGEAFDRIADRTDGKPKQINENLNMTMTYQDFLDTLPDE